jgi:hypothetical protein
MPGLLGVHPMRDKFVQTLAEIADSWAVNTLADYYDNYGIASRSKISGGKTLPCSDDPRARKMMMAALKDRPSGGDMAVIEELRCQTGWRALQCLEWDTP